jgi:RNA polymerase sigma-70 factor (ECF subfamily)
VSELKEQTDEELYRLMRQGSQPAFAELYDRHEPALFRFAAHLAGNRATGEEVAHEVFVRLMSAGAGFNERQGSLEAYLYGMARNLTRVALRKGLGEEGPEQAVQHDFDADLVRKERVAALYAAIGSLPERYREVLVMCDLEERSYEDAARLLACPIGTVRSRLHRARLFLAARLNPVPAETQAEATLPVDGKAQWAR